MALFAVQATEECLYTTVRNIAPIAKYFGFLRDHGARLDCGEELVVFGDLSDWIINFTTNHRERRSLGVAVAGDATNGISAVLAIVKTPAVHLYDAIHDRTKVLRLNDNTLGTVDPCWGSYSSAGVEC